MRRIYQSCLWILNQNQGFLIPPHPLTNFEIQKYYQNKPRFNRIYSRDNLSDKIRDGAYVTNLDEYSDVGTHWIALQALSNNVTYFSVEYYLFWCRIYPNIYPNLSDQQQFRSNNINEIKE